MSDREGSPVIASLVLYENPVRFDDDGTELVELLFHEDGTVTYRRPFGRHRAHL